MTNHRRRRVHRAAGVLACILALAASGCGGGGVSSVPTGAQVGVTLADHLTLTLSEDKTSASVGDKVTYQITLTNPTAAPITSTYNGYHSGTSTEPVMLGELLIPYDSGSFRVQNAAGNLILSDGSAVTSFPPIAPPLPVTVTIPPGQSLSATEVYTFTQAGVYTSAVALRNADSSATPAAGPLTVTVH